MRISTWFFYLTILLLPTQLGVHFWPDWTLVLGRRVDYLSPTIFLTDITILLTLITWFMQKHAIKNLAKTITQHTAIVVISSLFILINCIYSASPLLSLYKWGKVFEYLLFFYYIYASKPSSKKIIYALGIGVFYSSIIAIAQFYMQQTIGGIFWFLGERTFSGSSPGIAKVNWCFIANNNCRELLRPYATFPHPNVLGGFLAATLPLLVLALQKEKQKILRLFFILTIVLGIYTMGITFSRSGWIIGIGMIFGILLYSYGKHRLILGGIGILIILGLLAIAWPYMQTLTIQSESIFIRLDLADAAFTLFRAHVVTGTGLGTFLIELPQVINHRGLYFLQPVHNIYLLLLSEVGITGIMLITTLFYTIRKTLKLTKQKNYILLPLLAIGLLGLVDHYPITVQQGQLLTTCFLALPFCNTNS